MVNKFNSSEPVNGQPVPTEVSKPKYSTKDFYAINERYMSQHHPWQESKTYISQKRVPPLRNERCRGSQGDVERRKKMRNTEDDDTDEEVEDIDLDHYKDDPRLKIFGNPTVKKTQSFSYTKKATPVYEALVTSGCQNTPSNTPHSSSPLSTSPISSPALNPRQMAVALALQVIHPQASTILRGYERRRHVP